METYIHMPWPTFPKVAAMPASPQKALRVCSFQPTGLAFGAQDPTLSTGPPRAASLELDEPEIQRRGGLTCGSPFSPVPPPSTVPPWVPQEAQTSGLGSFPLTRDLAVAPGSPPATHSPAPGVFSPCLGRTQQIGSSIPHLHRNNKLGEGETESLEFRSAKHPQKMML